MPTTSTVVARRKVRAIAGPAQLPRVRQTQPLFDDADREDSDIRSYPSR